MSLTFKLFSLGIRTLAKPIGNYIKKQAKEHEGFRRFAIAQAQRVHRIDMRMRLGILHDPAAQERMHERERKAAEAKKKEEETPTVRMEKEQKEYEQKKEREAKGDREGAKKKEDSSKIKIRPLSDARAIDLGANFFSEAFIFGVAVGLLLLENWRSRNKESNRRDGVAERFEAIEADLERLKKEHNLADLEALNEKVRKAREERESYSWYNPAGWWSRFGPGGSTVSDEGVPGEVDESKPSKAPADSPASPPEQPKVDSANTKPSVDDKRPEEPAKATSGTANERIDTTAAQGKQR